MGHEEAEPVEGEIVLRFTDAQLPTVALLLDSVELSEQGRGMEALGAVADALRKEPLWTMGAIIGFMRGGVHALAACREEEFTDTLAMLRSRSAQ